MVTIAPTLNAFASGCLRLEPGTQNGGIAPGDPNQGGYHNSREKLLQLGKGGDYSLRHPWDKRGNASRARAFDWTFPDAQAGRFGTIRKYGNRVRAAYNRRDARLTGWREVLIRTDAGIQGFDFAEWYTRTPDGTHGWHGHFSIMNEFVDETWPYTNMLSILSGQEIDVALTPDEVRKLTNCDTYLWYMNDLEPEIPINGNGDVLDSALVRALRKLFTDVQEIRGTVEALQAPGAITQDMLDLAVRRALRSIPDA